MAKIINFHQIDDINWFEETIKVILSMYKIVSMEDLEAFYAGKIKGNFCHITVDDGHISTYTHIYPILKKYNITASIYVSPKATLEDFNFWFQEMADYEVDKINLILQEQLQIPLEKLNKFFPFSVLKSLTIAQIHEVIERYQKKYKIEKKSRQNVNLQQLKELHHSGHFHIGAHTLTHPILANENKADAEKEIKESIVKLSEMLDFKVRSFAYPNGTPKLDFGQREKEILQHCEIQNGFSFEFKKISPQDTRLSIPRFGLSHGNAKYIKSRLYFGEYWENLRDFLFMNETKWRKRINNELFPTV